MFGHSNSLPKNTQFLQNSLSIPFIFFSEIFNIIDNDGCFFIIEIITIIIVNVNAIQALEYANLFQDVLKLSSDLKLYKPVRSKILLL
jgi:hypothetical protein